MKKSILFTLALAITAGLTALSFSNNKEASGLEVGDKAPKQDHKLINPLTNKETSLSEQKGENGLLVVFSCNTCPFVVAWEDRYNELNDIAMKGGVEMVLINSNEAKRSGDDSPEAMIKHARENTYKMPYLIDENHRLADAFGAKTTPHVYLFDKDMKLAYVGAIDSDHRSRENATNTFAKDALEALAAGKEINPNTTPAKGCSIKRVKPRM